MGVRIKLSQVLQQLAGNQNMVEVEGSTIRQCLENLIKEFPGTGKWLFDEDGKLQALVLINGETLHPRDLNRPVIENDELYILTMIGGG